MNQAWQTVQKVADQLSDFYEPADVRLWLFSRQKLLKSETPADLIQQGRANEVIAVIDQLRDGVYI